MAGVQDQLEIKFRLTDGSDIGPKSFPAATNVSTLKESILAQWPKGKNEISSNCEILQNKRNCLLVFDFFRKQIRIIELLLPVFVCMSCDFLSIHQSQLFYCKSWRNCEIEIRIYKS